MIHRDIVHNIALWLLPQRALRLRRISKIWAEAIDLIYPRGLNRYLRAISLGRPELRREVISVGPLPNSPHHTEAAYRFRGRNVEYIFNDKDIVFTISPRRWGGCQRYINLANGSCRNTKNWHCRSRYTLPLVGKTVGDPRAIRYEYS